MTTDYDTEVLRWSGRIAGNGERLNDQVDWANVIEEIESVGPRSFMPSNRC